MKRSPLPSRTKPLSPRKKPIRKRNDKRMRALRLAQYGPPETGQGALAERSPCFTCGRDPPSEPAHVGRSRGAAGLAKDVIPLCGGIGGCHGYAHAHGERALERLFGREEGELVEEAARLARVVEGWRKTS